MYSVQCIPPLNFRVTPCRGMATDQMPYKDIIVERQDKVLLVILNRPKALNALNANVM